MEQFAKRPFSETTQNNNNIPSVKKNEVKTQSLKSNNGKQSNLDPLNKFKQRISSKIGPAFQFNKDKKDKSDNAEVLSHRNKTKEIDTKIKKMKNIISYQKYALPLLIILVSYLLISSASPKQ